MAWTCDVSIEEKVRQDCYNRGYEQGRKNPCDEIVAYIEELQNQVKVYQDKIEQGKMIELPCKVGDMAYHLTSANTLEELGVAEIFDGEVISISKEKDGLWIYCHYNNGLNFWYSKREIGRKLFFTREEAEKRLKELQNG